MATFDIDQALDQLDGDLETLAVLVSTFQRTSPKQLDQMDGAIGLRDGAALAATAHCFKGSLGVLGAGPALELTRQLEVHAREADFVRARATLHALRTECHQLTEDLSAEFGTRGAEV